MARRKRKNNIFINIILVLFIIFFALVIVKAIEAKRDRDNKEIINEEKEKIKTIEKEDIKEEKDNKEETKEDNKKPSTDEKTENKNEVNRKGGVINLEIKGEDEITIKKGDKYIEPGFIATYEDGTDASNEVKVEGEVDTEKTGTYTISYSVGNNIILRRVYVE